MKKLFLLVGYILLFTICRASDFITIWDLSNSGSTPTSITFGTGTTGIVNYSWETIPVGTSGGGTFSGTLATITGLPIGAKIRLKIDSANFNRFNMSTGINDRLRLLNVEQWGTIAWSSMSYAFKACNNLNITATDIPDLSLVTDLSYMFAMSTTQISVLNGPSNIGNWNTSNVTNMSYLFSDAQAFNQPIGNWNTSNVTNMSNLFSYAHAFNQPIGNWNTSNVTNMSYLFSNAFAFNQPIGNWNTSSVTNMQGLFYNNFFNQPIGNWNTSNVTNMSYLFAYTWSFNQPIGNWNTSNVTSMRSMFDLAFAFNQPIGNWNTSNVTNMGFMFQSSQVFNQPIGNWNTLHVTDMIGMFQSANSFNQIIGNWNLSNLASGINMLSSCGMDCSKYSDNLIGFSGNNTVPNYLHLGAYNLRYNQSGQAGRAYLINTKHWIINGDMPNSGICCSTSYGSNVITACDSYFWYGNNYTSSGLYYYNFINSWGCKSIYVLNLTISNSSITSLIQTACDSFTWLGNTYTSSGIYKDTFSNSNGCDSISILNLTILNSSITSLVQTACDSFTWLGNTYTSSGIYKDTFLNSNGCDSISILNLTITYVNNKIIKNESLYTALANNSVFQWVNCPNYNPILNATAKNFKPNLNGLYAVIVSTNGCIDTSDCIDLNTLKINIYPIPAIQYLTIENPTSTVLQYCILNILGQTVRFGNLQEAVNSLDISALARGVYLLKINNSFGEFEFRKILKE
jgi:surface protein